jgi:hypothetical protein
MPTDVMRRGSSGRALARLRFACHVHHRPCTQGDVMRVMGNNDCRTGTGPRCRSVQLAGVQPCYGSKVTGNPILSRGGGKRCGYRGELHTLVEAAGRVLSSGASRVKELKIHRLQKSAWPTTQGDKVSPSQTTVGWSGCCEMGDLGDFPAPGMGKSRELP